MIRTEAEYRTTQERLEQDAKTIQMQREQLEEMELSDEEVERALEISFRDPLRDHVETLRAHATRRPGGPAQSHKHRAVAPRARHR